MRFAYQMVLYVSATLLVTLSLLSAKYAGVAWEIGGSGGGALAVVLLQLALVYAFTSAALIARARGYLRFLTASRLHLLATVVAFSTVVPIILLLDISSPAAAGLLALLLGFIPTAFYAAPWEGYKSEKSVSAQTG